MDRNLYLWTRKIIRSLAGIYLKLPIKPFKGKFLKLYLRWNLIYKNEVIITERDGIKWELHLDQLIDRSIYYEGCFEPTVVALYNRYLKEGMTVLDIGANIGCHTLRFAKLVGESGKVVAFEPMSWAFSKLKRNVELNDFNNVILENIALSSESKGNSQVEFYCSWPLGGDSGSDAQLHPVHKGYKMKDVAEIITLDDYMRRADIKKVDFIKLDVDGYEHQVICGGMHTVKTFKPLMIVEFAWENENLGDLLDRLISLGYSFYSDKNLARYDNKDAILNIVSAHRFVNFFLSTN